MSARTTFFTRRQLLAGGAALGGVAVATLNGRILASGIPGASAVASIGAGVLVGSRSNFGAPKVRADQAAGSFLCIDSWGGELRVPPRFASSAHDGAVRRHSTVANPLGLSITNSGGGFSPASAPYGLIERAAVGTALLGRVVVRADGSIDGVAPARTVQPLAHRSWRYAMPRLGVVNSSSRLYVSQPFDDSIRVIQLAGDPASARTVRSWLLAQPVDLAPVLPDSASTTLPEGSDIFVCNRGNATIVRMRQDGSVAAVRRVLINGWSLGRHAWLNGIATSADGARLFVTYVGSLPGSDDCYGGVVELPTF
ncbi:YncE family protein [Tenggerimyces flavus]|uniref:Uncharacterized protein n=1 Tax=Tenggerimyces flavus TaxID=1708749 RepID=A0ABV7Y7B8_9ACTN|nr:hypothetical protein [Tenggerimyces flavus]MBM7785125.1 hypothetical protein [Tenggerimyces flavus]